MLHKWFMQCTGTMYEAFYKKKKAMKLNTIDDFIGYCGINIIAYFRGLYAKINTKLIIYNSWIDNFRNKSVNLYQ